MKTKLRKMLGLSLMAILLSGGSVFAQTQNAPDVNLVGLGPVISVSENYESLPDPAKNFISTYFPSAVPIIIQLKPMEDVYDVELSNGYELEFSKVGEWLEIEAPGNKAIATEILQGVLPAATMQYLTQKKMLSLINEVKYSPSKGFKLEAVKIQDLYFDGTGAVIKNPKK